MSLMMSKPDVLTLTAVFSHVALLTLAVVFCARSTVHAANVTVLDCGESTCSLDYLHSKIHRQFLKVMVRCNFLKKLWGLKITLDWNANGPGSGG